MNLLGNKVSFVINNSLYYVSKSAQSTSDLQNKDDNHVDVKSETSLLVIDKGLSIWIFIDVVLMVAILCGNIMTILAVRFSRKLRRVISNYFVLSLAISDSLVGLTLPYHMIFYMGTNLGASKKFCLLRFFFVIMACCVSIWNLIAIAVDRYIAICYPLHYGRCMTRRAALILMSIGWLIGFSIATVPIIWNKWDYALECEFDQIFFPWYLVGVITPMFSLVWVFMLIMYWRIWREAVKHVKQLRVTGMGDGPSDWKSVQVVLLILGCFTICWLPYFIVSCAQIFQFIENSSPIIYKAAFSLAMSNSAMNPLIYAWKNTGFRRAFSQLLKCKSPDVMEQSPSMRSNLHRRNSSIQPQEKVADAFPNFSTPPFKQRKVDPLASMEINYGEHDEEIYNHIPDSNIQNKTTNIPDGVVLNNKERKLGRLSLKVENLIADTSGVRANGEAFDRKVFKENILYVHSTNQTNCNQPKVVCKLFHSFSGH